MSFRNVPRQLFLVFCAVIALSAIPIGFHFKELATLRWNVEQFRDAASVAKQTRVVSDRINSIATNIKALDLELAPSKRSIFITHTNRQITLLKRAIRNLEAITTQQLRTENFAGLRRFAEQTTIDWKSVESKLHSGLSREDRLKFFLRFTRNVRAARATVSALQSRSAKLADAQATSTFARLRFAGFIVIVGLVIWIALTAITFVGIFRLLSSTREANSKLAKSRNQLQRAQSTIKKRSQQLIETQRLGKIGDWSYKLRDSETRWGPELYELLGFTAETFKPTNKSIQARFIGNGAQVLRDAQSEVLRTGEVKSVDVKFRRGDGSIGDFVLTSKLERDSEGNPLGIAGTIQDISERKHAETQLQKLAYYDPLTGLANRAMFQGEIEDVLRRCQRAGTNGALLLLDLDRFKDVNDSLGHAAGDELLVKVGHLIARVLGNEHFLARLGGDEFAIIVSSYVDRSDIEKIATDVIAALSKPIFLERGEVCIGTSVGISLLTRDGNNASDLLRNADLALYKCKEDGRGRHLFFESDMNAAVQFKTALARDLRHAVSSNVGLHVHYQPQVDLSTNTVSGFEALLRWQHPTRGPIPPSEFIPIAESSRLICDLGGWILRHAVIQASEWIAAGEPPRSIAVNVSAAQIWHMDLTSQVKQVLQETGLPPHLLCLELTESLFADHSEVRVRSVLNELKALGVTLALDDFGTGYSSLGYLTQLPFDKLKIDRVFIDGADNSERAQELLNGIVSLGRGLGMTVVGEGTEKLEEVSLLREYGCHTVQGFYFAPPTMASEAMKFAHQLEAKRMVNGAQEPRSKNGKPSTTRTKLLSA